MSIRLPSDLPKTPFVYAGVFNVDGSAVDHGQVTNSALISEIGLVERNPLPDSVKTQREWQQVRHVLIYFFLTARDGTAVAATNAFLRNIGLDTLNVQSDTPTRVFQEVEYLHDKSQSVPFSPPDGWIKQRPPTRRLPPSSPLPSHSFPLSHNLPLSALTRSASFPVAQGYEAPSISPQSSSLTPYPRLSASPVPISTRSNPRGSTNDPRPNASHHPLYSFADHKQEYEGHQFQCPHRCLKDGKHCRKAPVREMNRHLRERHKMAHGFKIAGVDWDKKRWRGAGGGEPECVGKIVEKDAADDESSDDEKEECNSVKDKGDGKVDGKHEDNTVNGRTPLKATQANTNAGSVMPDVKTNGSVTSNVKGAIGFDADGDGDVTMYEGC